MSLLGYYIKNHQLIIRTSLGTNSLNIHLFEYNHLNIHLIKIYVPVWMNAKKWK